MHSLVNDLSQFLLIPFLDEINLVPSIVFDPVPLFLMILHHPLDVLLEPVGLLDLLLELDLLLILQLLDDLLVVHEQLVQSQLELVRLLLLLVH